MTVPNVSEGRDLATLEAIGRAFAPAYFLDLHTDPDHDRAVFTLAARQGEMADALLSGARSAIARIDISAHTGIHPHVGALDVMPVVYLDEERRGAAIAETLTAAALIGEELGVPVFLYGELATRPERAEVAGAELIGLAPRAAFEGFPADVPLRGFEPERHILEDALRAVA
jgi:glutamate formiminotransferase/glutamate formiminotransferase/formiminotetrahydrofolate cyclodeaminase